METVIVLALIFLSGITGIATGGFLSLVLRKTA